MARWTAFKGNWTPVAVADATNFTNEGHLCLQGGSTTQRLRIREVKLGGLATSSAPTHTVLARNSTVGASSLSGVLNSAINPGTAALSNPPLAYSTSTTKPQRSSTLQVAGLGFNAFGGRCIQFWDDRDPLEILGNAASFGELSISSLNSGTPGLLDAHIIYEPL